MHVALQEVLAMYGNPVWLFLDKDIASLAQNKKHASVDASAIEKQCGQLVCN